MSLSTAPIQVNSAILLALNKNNASRLERLFRLIVWNHNQYLTKGESSHPPSVEQAAVIAQEQFGSDDDTEDSL